MEPNPVLMVVVRETAILAACGAVAPAGEGGGRGVGAAATSGRALPATAEQPDTPSSNPPPPHLSASTTLMWDVPWSSGCTPAALTLKAPPYSRSGSGAASDVAALRYRKVGKGEPGVLFGVACTHSPATHSLAAVPHRRESMKCELPSAARTAVKLR